MELASRYVALLSLIKHFLKRLLAWRFYWKSYSYFDALMNGFSLFALSFQENFHSEFLHQKLFSFWEYSSTFCVIISKIIKVETQKILLSERKIIQRKKQTSKDAFWKFVEQVVGEKMKLLSLKLLTVCYSNIYIDLFSRNSDIHSSNCKFILGNRTVLFKNNDQTSIFLNFPFNFQKTR